MDTFLSIQIQIQEEGILVPISTSDTNQTKRENSQIRQNSGDRNLLLLAVMIIAELVAPAVGGKQSERKA